MLTYSNGWKGLPLVVCLLGKFIVFVGIKSWKIKSFFNNRRRTNLSFYCKIFYNNCGSNVTKKTFDFIAVDEILCMWSYVFTDRLLNLNPLFYFWDLNSMEKILKSLFPKSTVLKKKKEDQTYLI